MYHHSINFLNESGEIFAMRSVSAERTVKWLLHGVTNIMHLYVDFIFFIELSYKLVVLGFMDFNTGRNHAVFDILQHGKLNKRQTILLPGGVPFISNITPSTVSNYTIVTQNVFAFLHQCLLPYHISNWSPWCWYISFI